MPGPYLTCWVNLNGSPSKTLCLSLGHCRPSTWELCKQINTKQSLHKICKLEDRHSGVHEATHRRTTESTARTHSVGLSQSTTYIKHAGFGRPVGDSELHPPPVGKHNEKRPERYARASLLAVEESNCLGSCLQRVQTVVCCQLTEDLVER